MCLFALWKLAQTNAGKGILVRGNAFGKAGGESDNDTIKRQRVCGAWRWTWTHSVGRVLLLAAKVELAVGLECQHLLGLAWSTGLVYQSSSTKLILVNLKNCILARCWVSQAKNNVFCHIVIEYLHEKSMTVDATYNILDSHQLSLFPSPDVEHFFDRHK